MESQCWFFCYPEKLLTDTLQLSAHDFGAYCLALMWYYANGPLPDDDEILRNIMRVEADKWDRTKGIVLSYFFQNGDGKFHQKRADIEIKRRDDYIACRKAQTKAARDARWGNKQSASVTGSVTDSAGLSPAQIVLYDRELQTVVSRMKSIRDGYSQHQTWRSDDRERFEQLRARRDELKGILNVKVT